MSEANPSPADSARPATPRAAVARASVARALLWAALAMLPLMGADRLVRPRPEFEARYYLNFNEGAPQDPFLIRRDPAPGSWSFPDMLDRPGRLRVVYTGFARIKYPGTYHFFVGTRDGQRAWMDLDGKPIAGTHAGPDHPWRGVVRLDKGLHPIRLEYRDDRDDRDEATANPKDRVISLMWGKEIDVPQRIPAYAMVGPDARPWRFAASSSLRLAAAALVLWILWSAPSLMMAPRALRLLRFRFVAFGASFLFCALALEVGLRLGGYKPRAYVPGDIWLTYKFPRPNSVTSYKGYLPYHVQEFETEVRINARGWRDHDYAIPKPPGVRRVLVVGDSYVEGKEVELDRTFHKLLERRLNEELSPQTGSRYEVPALGKGGSSTIGHLDFLTSPGLALQPDVVVLSVFPGNDIRENSVELTAEYQKWLDEVYRSHMVPARISVIDKLTILPWSYLNQFFVDKFSDFYVGRLNWFHRDLQKNRMVSNDLDVYRDKTAGSTEPDARWEKGWSVTEDFIVRARDEAEAGEAKFLVMFVFSAQLPGYDSDKLMNGSAGDDLDLRRPFRRLEEICARHGIRYLNLQPILADHERKTGQRYYWKYDAHWNGVGHEVAADSLFNEIANMERPSTTPAANAAATPASDARANAKATRP